MISLIIGSLNSGTMRPDSGKSVNRSVEWKILFIKLSAAEGLSSPMKAAISCRSYFAMGDQLT